jgi:peptidyl-prolyl cis-trans isomerase A (cyclophilin A)
VHCHLALVLFELDAFPKSKRLRKRSSIQQQLLSPEKMLLQQKEEFHHAVEEDPIEPSSTIKNDILVAPDEESKEESSILPPQPRRFVMKLGGLVDTADTQQIMFETRPDWAPIGAAHLHQLIDADFYHECRFFRVVPRFMVQFGIAASPAVQDHWKRTVLPDDPVLQTNARGTISFAMSGTNTRTTQLFINTVDNSRLDGEGFAPIAVVLDSGMEWIDRVNSKYREKPGQGKITARGNDYLNEEFPDLSYIVSIRPYEEEDKEEMEEV